jgi:hypothetical protein
MPTQRCSRFQQEPSYLVRATMAACIEATIQPSGMKSNCEDTEDEKTEPTPQMPERCVRFAPLPRREDFLDNINSISTLEDSEYMLPPSPPVW